MKKIVLLLITLFAANVITAQNWNPSHPGWTDSFAANGFCWCASTNYDHELDTKSLQINGTNYNIVDVCDELKNHPSYRAFQNGDAPYNDIQCGNGPANNADDEQQGSGCPGRTDLGSDGCDQIGPTFDMDWLESRAMFGGNTTTNPTPTPTPTPTAGNVVHITKRNATGFAIDGDGGAANGQNVYIWAENDNNVNQQWIEIDRGNGYYSYQKVGTNHCIDGNRDGASRQNVYLWQCSDNNQNQHWQKVSVGGNAFKLVKRNAPGFALDGGSNGQNGQNIQLWRSGSTSQNLHWIITPTGTSAKSISQSADNKNLKVYPNPVVDVLTVALNDDKVTGKITFEISDITGRNLGRKVTTDKTQEFHLNRLASGVYLLEVTTNVSKYIKRIIKQ